MAITITTSHSFLSDDGTQLNDTTIETVDQDNDASAPTRYQCPTTTSRAKILGFEPTESFGAADAAGVNTLVVINRDDSNSAQIWVSNTNGDDYTLILGVNEWHVLPICSTSLNGGAYFDLAQIDALSANAPGTIELLVFKNPNS
jgi:hypothetical protein